MPKKGEKGTVTSRKKSREPSSSSPVPSPCASPPFVSRRSWRVCVCALTVVACVCGCWLWARSLLLLLLLLTGALVRRCEAPMLRSSDSRAQRRRKRYTTRLPVSQKETAAAQRRVNECVSRAQEEGGGGEKRNEQCCRPFSASSSSSERAGDTEILAATATFARGRGKKGQETECSAVC